MCFVFVTTHLRNKSLISSDFFTILIDFGFLMYVNIIYEQYIPYNLLGFVKISRMKIMYYFPNKNRENASYGCNAGSY